VLEGGSKTRDGRNGIGKVAEREGRKKEEKRERVRKCAAL